MRIIALDKNFATIKYLSYTNLQWTRRYYKCGQFAIQILAKDYEENFGYIYTPERPELGIIHSVQYEDKAESQYVLLSGYFYEYELNSKIIYPRVIKRGTPEIIARSLVEDFKEDIPKLQLGEIFGNGTTTSVQETGGELGSRLYSILKTQDYSYHCRYNYEDDVILFEVWKGLDRTQDQNENPFATFSKGFRNMRSVKCTFDTSNFKNYAVVVGNGKYEEGQQITTIIDNSSGGYKKKIYVDATSLVYNNSEQTMEQYLQTLVQKGNETLGKHSKVDTVKFEPDVQVLKYLEDYDLGDLCDIIISDLSISYQARITEIKEVFKENKHTISLSFGTLEPTIYEKARIE